MAKSGILGFHGFSFINRAAPTVAEAEGYWIIAAAVWTKHLPDLDPNIPRDRIQLDPATHMNPAEIASGNSGRRRRGLAKQVRRGSAPGHQGKWTRQATLHIRGIGLLPTLCSPGGPSREIGYFL